MKDMLNQIITGDARELAALIPDESIDLIFTDPVYSEKPLYDLLASVALRVLKPHGAVLCWSNGKWHRQNANWLEAAGLTYRYDFAMTWVAGNYPMNGKIISGANRVLWFDKNSVSRQKGYLKDGFVDNIKAAALPSIDFKWFKSYGYSMRAMDAFSCTDAIVLDLYCGGGSIPAMCRQSNR